MIFVHFLHLSTPQSTPVDVKTDVKIDVKYQPLFMVIFPFILWKMEPPAWIIIPHLPHIDNLLRHLPLRPFQPFHSILKHGFRHLLNASDMIPGKHCV